MSKKYKIVVNVGKNENSEVIDVAQKQGDRGQTLRIQAKAGAKYQLQEMGKDKNAAPEYVRVKRVGKNLHLIFEDGIQSDVIIEDYYGVMPEGYNGIVGETEQGIFYEYIPEDPNTSGLIPRLADGGELVSVALGGGEVVGSGAAIGILAFNPLLAALGLAGAGVAAAAAGAAGTNSDAPQIVAVTDNVGNPGGATAALVSGGPTNDNTPTLSGTTTPNAVVTVKDGDTVLGTTTAGPDGKWSFTPTTALGEGQHSLTASTTANGTTSTSAPFVVEVDTKPPVATLAVDPVTADNLISVQEAGLQSLPVTGKVTGGFKAGDIVTVSVNGKSFTGTVNAEGQFSINVPTAELAADPDTKLEATIALTDAAGNTGTASGVTDYNLQPGVAPNTAPVNNLPTTPQSAVGGIGKSLTGLSVSDVDGNLATVKLSVLNGVLDVSLNGATVTSGANGTATLTLSGTQAQLNAALASLTYKPNANFVGVDNLSIVSTDAGGTPQSDADNLSITVTPATPLTSAITLNPVTGDNIISPAEGSQSAVTLTGKVTGAYTAGDVVTLNLNDRNVTGAVNAAGEFSIPVNMTDLKADADKTVQASVLAKDPVTGQTQVASNSQSYAVEDTPGTGVSLQLNTVTSDNIINKAESQSANTAVAGKVNGTVANGDIVSLQINSKTFTTTVDAQGNFSVNVPTSDLLADTDTQVNASVLSSTGQTKATAIQNYNVDTAVPVANVSVNNLTPDNLISAQEAAQATLPVTGKVTGEFRPGDVVSVTVNDKTFTAAVDAQGNYSVPVPTTDLLADPDTKLQVSVLPTDASGNLGQSATAEQDYAVTVVNPPETATVIFNPVAGDNIISPTEGNQSTVSLTGKVTGPFTVGDVVTVSLNDKNVTGAVNAAGEFSIPVNMTDLKADADKTVQASVLAKDPVTGQTQVASNSQTYAVENTPGTGFSLQLNAVTADNIINKAESLNANTAVAGKVNGTVANGDIVSLQINSKTFTTTVDAQGNFSVNVPTSDLLADTDTQVNASLLSSTGQTKATAIQNYAVDTAVPVASVSVNNLTPDNLISAQEAAQGTLPVTGKVTGEFRPGDVVSVTVNDKTFTAAVDAQGNYSVPVPTTDLLADPDTKLQVSVLPTDASGNPGQSAAAVLDYATAGVIPPETPTATVILNPVAGDNIISQAEGNLTTSTLTGKVTGPFTVGDVVTVSINDKNVTGAVNAAGEFSIPVNMTDLKADADKTVQASVQAKDPVTGQTQVVGNSQNYAVETTPGTGVSLQLNTVTTDNIINKAESLNANTAVAGKVNGTVANGDIVSLQINSKTFTTTVDAQGNFSVNVPTSDLLADTDTQVNASVLSSTGQTKATAIQNYNVDTAVPVASVSVNNITSDNLISAQEANQATLPVTGKVTGEFRPGDVVSVSVNDKTFTAAVDAQGNFSVPVPTTDLLADPDTKLQVSVLPTDASGNPGQSAAAVLDYAATGVNPPTNAAVIFNPVAGDNIISAAEGSQPTSTLTGKVTGPFTVGDVVTVSLNDKTVTGAVNAAGEFSIPVNMTDLKADADKTVQASVLAKDPVTGQTQLVSNSQTYGVDATGNPDSALVLDPVAGDNLINAIEAASPNTPITGKVTGEFAAGDVVTVNVNNQTFTAAVNAQGQFSVSVPTTQLLQDADSKIEVSAKVTTASGLVTTTAAQDYSVDTTPPVATVSVNNLTPDNLISAQEAAQGILPVTGKVTGEFRPGDVVSVSVNDKTFTAAVDAQGNFSVPVPTTDLLADPDTKLQVSVLPTDAAGNPGQSAAAVLDYATTGVNPPTNAAVIFNPVAGDNIISQAEGNLTTSTLTGKVTGPFTVGDVVTVSLNDKTVTGAVNAAGEFSIPVNMTDLKADADKTVQASVLAKDPVTGQTQLVSNSQTYSVDATGNPDSALVLDPVAGDNLINAIEAASPNTPITGKVTGEFAAGDVVTVSVNNQTFTAAVNAQGQFSVSVPTTQLLQDADSKIEVSAKVTTASGLVTTTAAQDYSFDSTPPVASVSVNNITSDNLISAQEANQSTLPVTGKVTGEFRPGDVVSVTVNDKTFTAAVDAQGNYSVPVPTIDLLADPDTQLQVSVRPTDGAGNPGQSATAELDYATGVNPPTNAAVILNPVAGDNIISLAEGNLPTSTLTGKVTGPFTVGDVVTVSLNNKTVTGTVNALGEFSIPVNMTDLKADADETVQVSVLAKDPVTGQTQLVSNSQTYDVDVTGNPGSALVLDPVAGDNLINGIEAANLNTPITGKVTGEFAAGDVVSVHVNNQTFTAAVNAQGQFSVSVPTAHLVVDADSKIEASAKVTTATGLVTTTAAQDYVVVTDSVPVTIGATDPDADGKINASGTAEPQSVVTVTWPDGTTSTTATNPNGAWAVESPTVQPEGQVQAVAVGSNGNPSQPATAQYVDNTAPLVNITEPVVQNPNGTLTVSGTGEPGAKVVVTGVNGTPVGTTTVDPTGQWTLTSPGAVPFGTLTATATDVNGEVGTDTAPYTQGLDITNLDVKDTDGDGKPTVSGQVNKPNQIVTITDPAGQTHTVAAGPDGKFTLELDPAPSQLLGTYTATAVNGADTASESVVETDLTAPVVTGVDVVDTDGDGKPTISGQTEPNLVVTVTDPAGGTHTVAAGPDGKFTLEIDPAPSPLTGPYTVTAVDPAGNTSAPVTVTETDLTAPVITNLDAKDTDGDGKPTVSGLVDTPNSVVTITDPSGATHTTLAGSTGAFSLELPAAPTPLVGTYTATAKDAAGNTSLPVSVTETDLTAPVLTNVDVVDTDGDGKPTISGQTEPNLVVTVTDPAGGTHTVAAGPDGKFTLEIDPAPSPLTGPYTVTAVDPAGNTSAPVTVTETDLTAPVITNLDAKDTDGDGKPTVSGLVDTPNSVVTITDPSGATHTTLAGSTGAFSLELPAAPTPLVGTYTATAKDAAGNTSLPVSVTETDLTAPVVTNVDVVDTDGDGKPTISGQTEPNLVVTVTDPAGGTHTVAAGPDGKFTLEIDPAPSPLTGPYTVTAVDPAGNTSAPVTVTETDLTAPVITNLDAKDTDGDGKPTVSGLVDTPNSVVTITDPSGATHTTLAGPTGAFSLELPAAPTPLVGTYTATAKDAAGNTSLPVSVTETDLTAPVLTNVDVVDTDGDGKPTISGQTEPNLVVTVTDPAGGTHTVAAGPDGKFTLEIDPAPSPLTGPYTVTAVDPAGNTSAPVTVTETDLTAPVITNLDAKDTDGDGKPTVSGLVDTPNAVVTITDPSGTTHTTLAGPTGAFSLELPAVPTPLVGTYTATAKDAAGNTSLPVSVTETDLTAPVITNVDVVDTDGDGKPTVGGQTEPNLVVTITDPAGNTHTVAAGPDGKFSLEIDPAPSPLTGPYTVTAVDPAGNTSAPVTVTETDLTAPVITNLDAKDPDADGKPTVSGLVDTPNAVVTITDPTGGTHTVTAGPTGEFSLELDPAPSQVLGTYTATAKDAAGNVSAPVSITETDLTGPVITNLDVKDTDGDGKPTVSGLVNEPNLVVTITDPEGITHTVVAGPDGKFSLELDPAPNPLLGTYTAVTVDGSNIPSLPVSVTETDLTAPVVTGVDVKETDGDGKPTVTGQVDEPNAVVTITDPAGGTHTVAAGPDGKFSLEIDPAPSPLTGPYTVTAVDPAGNTSAPVTVTETDLTAPVLTNVDVVDTDGDGKPTISGQTEPNLVVTVTDPAGGTHTVAAGPDGKFSLEIDPAPSPLTGPYTVTAVDPAGNTSAPVTVTETDLTAPVITNLDAKDTDGDGKPTVSGLVDTPNSVVTITDPAGGTHTVAAGPDGKFSLELDPAPSQLLGTYTATAKDAAGNISLPVSVVETDLTAPVVTGVDVVDTDGDGKPTVTGQVDEPNAVVTVTDPAGNTHTVAAGPDGKFSLEIDPAPSPLTGPYTVTAVDPAGNTSAPVTVTETDLTAPVITNLDAKDTDGDGKPTVSGLVDTPNAVVTIKDPEGITHTVLAGPDGKFSLELPAAPNPLLGTYTATAVDAAGNTSLPVSVVETDLTAPVVTGVGVGDPDGDGKPTVSGQVDEPNLVVTITDPAGGTHTTVSGPDGAFTLEIDPAPSPLTGTYGVTAVDPGGNTSAPVTAQLGGATPVLIDEPVVENLNGTITVTGTGEQGAQIEVKDVNNVLVGTATVLPNGTWSLNSAGEVPQGQLTAKSTNLNQQITSDTAPYNNTPVAVLDVAQGTEDSISLTGNVGTNDTHKDGSETYELTSQATGTHGSLTFDGTGAWTYTRTANLDAIQTAAEDIFTYKIKDASGKESTAQLKITLDPVNDAPKVSYSTVQYATYFENAEPVVARGAQVAGGVVLTPVLLTDVDSANLSGATVRVGNFSSPNAFMPGDVLSFDLPANSPISGAYNSTTGVLTFTGTATVAQYQDALSSVKYSHTKDDYATDGNRKIFWSVTDDGGLVNPGNLPYSWVVVKRLNDAPVLPDANLVLPTIEPLNTLTLPTDVNKYALGISINNLVTGVTDADGPNVTKGVAIIGYNKDMGTLYLSADGGETWATPSFDIDSSNAILLRGQANRRVYFQPHVGVEGTIADALTIRAWDASNNVVESVNGLQVTGYNITTVGGITPYSSATDTVSLTVATLASSPAYKGTAGDDVINASVGPDVILANGGVDQIFADDGNDKVVINESNVQSLSLSNTANLDGGTGVNTLKLTVANMFLDLTNVTVQSKVNNFSVLDITGNGKNTLKIDLSTVQNLSGAADNSATATVDESKMLVVQADQGDAVVLNNTLNWASLSGLTGDSLATLYGTEYGFIADHKYTQLSQSGATLFVDELAPVADIVGTSGNDTLAGTASAEVLFGNGGVDQINAAAGNDTVILDAAGVASLAATNTASVDGGAEVNVLKITGVNVQMDLTDTTVAGKVQNFSVLDLRVGNGNKVKLSLQQVLDLSADVPDNAATTDVDESKMLVVHGTNQNTVQLVDSVNWSAVTNLGGTTLQNNFGTQFGFEPGRSYTQYTNSAGSATLFVDQLLNVDQL